MQQHGLTIITRIIPDQVESLRTLLNEIGNDISDNPHIKFSLFRTVHFMRWVILDAATAQGKSVPAQLVLSTNFDGGAHAHLNELATVAKEGLTKIYGHCIDFPAKPESADIARYLYRHRTKNAAFYNGTVGPGVAQVEDETNLWQAIQQQLMDSNPSQQWPKENPGKIREGIVEAIFKNPAFSWARKKSHQPFAKTFGMAVLGLGFLLVLALYVACWILAWLPTLIATVVAIVLIAGWWTHLRSLEKKDAANFKASVQSVAQVARLTQREDYKVQNQITHLVDIKPGLTRQIALRFVLWAINLLARLVFNQGNLAGIVTIHFARWAIIDGGKRLLFFSNYDGSWESYLGEFVDRAAIGLTGVWSNTEGFPPTKYLVMEGARNSVEFKAWAREKQIETQVWYSARKTVSVKNVNNNTAIRDGLSGHLNEEKTREWLLRL
ncbi:MAG: hypothetical protein H6581_04770 [Bacteroidia bacterium]|nr:hypothetical protein [Bacteroidia bacterium]